MPENSANSIANQIEQRMAELPQDVRDVVNSAQLGTNLRAIGQAHGLHIDQIAVLEDEVMLVMLGFFEPEDFNNQIATQLRLSTLDATAIAQEINQVIFLPIRESMIAFAASKRKAPVVPEPAQAKPQIPSAPQMPNAEKMLTETTVAKPIYKSDPYREPIEP